ncbi:hypothetical protein H920_12761 [Fukomys damarensis]|uniref:Uncharacterized protein n=1 Tax=Fukomys damarensis TaxID=885580 RepID=A0A091D5T6_FUKDA|nr:hypothetical protein H920_12761 [Fukomys damarensis]
MGTHFDTFALRTSASAMFHEFPELIHLYKKLNLDSDNALETSQATEPREEQRTRRRIRLLDLVSQVETAPRAWGTGAVSRWNRSSKLQTMHDPPQTVQHPQGTEVPRTSALSLSLCSPAPPAHYATACHLLNGPGPAGARASLGMSFTVWECCGPGLRALHSGGPRVSCGAWASPHPGTTPTPRQMQVQEQLQELGRATTALCRSGARVLPSAVTLPQSAQLRGQEKTCGWAPPSSPRGTEMNARASWGKNPDNLVQDPSGSRKQEHVTGDTSAFEVLPCVLVHTSQVSDLAMKTVEGAEGCCCPGVAWS